MKLPDHYFTPSPGSESRAQEISVRLPEGEYVFETDAGVFSRDGLDPGSRLLIDSMPAMHAGLLLDLGCGWGAVGAVLARRNPGVRVILSDVNRRALDLAERNIRRNGIRNAACVFSDGFSALNQKFDAIATNPPIRAGKAVIYGLFAQARDHLAPGGSLTVVIRKRQGADSAKNELIRLFGSAQTVERGGGYHILRAGGGV